MLARSLTAVCAVLFAASTASAQADHLQCFKIKDNATKAQYQADLVPTDNTFAVAPGCKITVPAKLLCIDVQKTNVTPPPPGSPAGADAQKYLCYKVKCPKQQLTTSMQDQFGTHTLMVKKAGLVCAPAPAPIPTTTTLCTDNDGDTYFTAPCGNDCDDGDPAVNPGQTEICNSVDDDCNGTVDDAPGTVTCGTGQCQNTVPQCTTCTPNSPSTEVCDGVDNDCDGQVDEALGTISCGVGQCQNTVTACVGGSPNTCTPNPAGPELCGTAIDEDCDGQVDEAPCGCATSAQCTSYPNAAGVCQFASCTNPCAVGYADCNGMLITDGCEVFIAGDPNNCGACANVCSGGTPNCVNSVCVP